MTHPTACKTLADDLSRFRVAQSVGIKSMRGMATVLRSHNPKRMKTADVKSCFEDVAAFLEKLSEVEEAAIATYSKMIDSLSVPQVEEGNQ